MEKNPVLWTQRAAVLRKSQTGVSRGCGPELRPSRPTGDGGVEQLCCRAVLPAREVLYVGTAEDGTGVRKALKGPPGQNWLMWTGSGPAGTRASPPRLWSQCSDQGSRAMGGSQTAFLFHLCWASSSPRHPCGPTDEACGASRRPSASAAAGTGQCGRAVGARSGRGARRRSAHAALPSPPLLRRSPQLQLRVINNVFMKGIFLALGNNGNHIDCISTKIQVTWGIKQRCN